jgi:hypothetical protein
VPNYLKREEVKEGKKGIIEGRERERERESEGSEGGKDGTEGGKNHFVPIVHRAATLTIACISVTSSLQSFPANTVLLGFFVLYSPTRIPYSNRNMGGKLVVS